MVGKPLDIDAAHNARVFRTVRTQIRARRISLSGLDAADDTTPQKSLVGILPPRKDDRNSHTALTHQSHVMVAQMTLPALARKLPRQNAM
jgi:hypothetical protein